MRLLFALRFRDLDLLISDQVTGNSQLLFHRSLARPAASGSRRSCATTRTRTSSSTTTAGWSTSRTPTRCPTASRTRRRSTRGVARDDRDSGRRASTTSATASRSRSTPTTARCTSTSPTRPTRSSAPTQGVFPTLFQPLDADAGRPARPPARPRGAVQRPDAGVRALPRHATPQQFFQNDDLWTVPTGQTSEQTLPSEAYYVVMRMPGESEAEFLLLQPMVPTNRPNMIAWVAARMDAPNYGATRVYRFPADTTIFGPAQIEARIDQDPIISQQVTLWNQSGSKVIRGNLIVVPARRFADLPPAGLPAVDRVGVPGVPADRRGLAARGRLGPDAGRGARPCCCAPRRTNAGPIPTPSPTPGPSPAPGATPTPGASPTPTPTSGPAEPLPADVAGLIDVRQAPLRPRPGGPSRRRLRPLRRGDRRASRPPSSGSMRSRPGSASAPGASASPAP